MKLDLTGHVYGKLTVLREEGRTPAGQVKWLCRCECGRQTAVAGGSLRSGNTKSCGCHRVESGRALHTTHGMSGTRTYRVWQHMMMRCYKETVISYADYGAKGVTVDERWHRFEDFLADMGEAPDGLTLDRKDNGLPYSAANCRWADRKTQGRNQTSNVWVEHEGVRRTLPEWAELTGIQLSVLYQRVVVHGWDASRALTRPVSRQRGKSTGAESLKNQARHAVSVAVRSGKLVRPHHCQHPGCEHTKPQGHHHNGYDKAHWLDVVWLCTRHHPEATEKLITYGGECRSISEWADLRGVPRRLLYFRLKQKGWVADDGVFAPKRPKGRLLTHQGRTLNVRQWSAEIGVSMQGIINRLKRGLSVEDALRPARHISQPDQGLGPGDAGSQNY